MSDVLEKIYEELGRLRAERANLRAELDALKNQKPVGVFTNVNSIVGGPPLWEQMTEESYDGVEYVYLYAAPKPGEEE